MAIKPLYQDPFAPVLLSSTPVTLSTEQRNYIREILEVACSDSRFAQKAYDAIQYVLTAPSVKVPTVSGLTPTSAVVGSPNFDLLVNGTNFDENTVIVFNGGEEPTTYVSATQVKTGVNMSTVSGPVSVPVLVMSKEGVLSNSMTFSFTSPVTLSAKREPLVEPKVVPPPPAVVKK